MAAPAHPGPLSFDDVWALVHQHKSSRTLPTAVLIGEIEEREVKILCYLLRCRTAGFMILAPAIPEVAAVLEQLVDSDGLPLVVTRESTVNLEDARGRKFGSGPVFLADLASECCQNFSRTPALRGAAQQGLLRLQVEGTVAKPSARSAMTVADQWIAEMSGQDDALLEYFTAEDEQPEEVGAPPLGSIDADVLQQMQARINELEASLVDRPPRPVIDLEPRPKALPGRSVLFEAVPNGVDEAAMQRLRQLAGPPPARLSRTEALPAPAQQAFLEEEAGVGTGEAVAQLMENATDPLHQLLALQVQQTAALMTRLAPQQKDPITAALGNESGSTSSGVKGCVAREAFLKTMEDVKATGKIIMSNAASDLGIPLPQVDSGLFRTYIERRIPLGDHRLLTCFAQFMAVGWQWSFEIRDEYAMGLMSRGIMMVEQMALDKGRSQFAWLLAAMPDPNTQLISMNQKRTGLVPYAKLAAPSWVAGNIAYLRDVDYLESRLKNPRAGDAAQPSKEDGTAAEEQKPKKPWRPKKGRQQKEDQAEGSAK